MTATASPTPPEKRRLDLSQAPEDYPGEPVAVSQVLLPNCEHPLTVPPGRRLGQARVERCDDCVERDGLRVVPLNYELLRWNVAGTDARYPVVAVGSNANADVLRGKMDRAGIEPIIPLIRARLDNLTVSHSAHVGGPGFVPAAPVRDPGHFCEIVVGFLDRDQLTHMDGTEPNYVRRWLPGADYPLRLDGGEGLDGFHIYDSKWGLLADGPSAFPLSTQREVSQWLAARGVAPWTDHDATSAAKALAADKVLRDSLRVHFLDGNLARPSELDGPVFRDVGYGTTASAWAEHPATSATSLRATTTPDLDRRGEHCVLLNPSDARHRNLRDHAEIRCALRPTEPGLIARVVVDEEHPPDSVGVDQIIRNGLGLERGEHVELHSAGVPRNPLADVLLARPHYVACRIQAADLSIVEQGAALLSPLTMSLLGVQPGARIVVEGVPATPGGAVPVVRIKAHEAPQEIVDRRVEFSGGGREARFPASRDALGVFPDLPWVFLDAATRTKLGLGSHRLRPIRVRAARGDQALAEIRELMLLFVLAAVGVASVITSTRWLLAFLGVLGVLAGLVARARLRRRLGG